jgi:phospholipid/cholesterol/gamma-HCH transport system ATP-binding protein
MSVWENVAFNLIYGKQMGRARAQEIALAKMAAVNLNPEVATLHPDALSGGMKKRVALARAIAADPEVIFFDEPTTGLDPIVSSVINELILKCTKISGASAVTITHDINSVRRIADRVALLYEGKFIWIGSVKEMDTTDNPYVRQFIHGYAHGPFTD